MISLPVLQREKYIRQVNPGPYLPMVELFRALHIIR